MGAEVALALTGVSALANLIGGAEKQKEGRKQARLIEAETDAAARQEHANVEQAKRRARVTFAKSGVKIDEGSPLEVLHRISTTGDENIRNIRRFGGARAQAARRAGRREFVNSLFGSAGQVGTALFQSGMFARGSETNDGFIGPRRPGR